jgi:outer membrane immunogenic protein
MRKTFFAAISFVILSAVAVHAQSLPQPLRPIGELPSPLNLIIPNYADLPVPYNWSGLLLHPLLTYQTASFSGRGGHFLKDAGGVGLGLDAAYNFQYGNIVFGPAADLTYSFMRSDSRRTSLGTLSSDLNMLGSVRGRLGYTLDRTLVYATGGYAFGNLKIQNYSLGASESNTLSGWTAGAGLEYLWSDAATLRVEYRRTELDGQRFASVPGNRKVKAGLNVITAGFSYKF